MNRILLTGSRTWTDHRRVEEALDAVLALGPMVLVHGACPSGADALAAEWAHRNGVPTEPHPADWDRCAQECPAHPHRIRKRPGDVDHPGVVDTYCPGAGPRRNKAMVDLGATVCLAFLAPGSRGTRNCLKLARKAGIKTQTWSA